MYEEVKYHATAALMDWDAGPSEVLRACGINKYVQIGGNNKLYSVYYDINTNLYYMHALSNDVMCCRVSAVPKLEISRVCLDTSLTIACCLLAVLYQPIRHRLSFFPFISASQIYHGGKGSNGLYRGCGEVHGRAPQWPRSNGSRMGHAVCLGPHYKHSKYREPSEENFVDWYRFLLDVKRRCWA